MFAVRAFRPLICCAALQVVGACSLDERTLYEGPSKPDNMNEGALGRGGSSTELAATSGTSTNGQPLGQAGEAGAPSGEPLPCPDIDANLLRDCSETLIDDAGFDHREVAWQPESDVAAAWTPDDAQGDPTSGALTVENSSFSEFGSGIVTRGVGKCLDADAGTSYLLLAEVRVPAAEAQGAGGVSVWFFSEPDCQGGAHAMPIPLLSVTPGWAVTQLKALAPASARSMRVRLVVSKPLAAPPFQVAFDNVLLREE